MYINQTLRGELNYHSELPPLFYIGLPKMCSPEQRFIVAQDTFAFEPQKQWS
jgi:hypothetical protein